MRIEFCNGSVIETIEGSEDADVVRSKGFFVLIDDEIEEDNHDEQLE